MIEKPINLSPETTPNLPIEETEQTEKGFNPIIAIAIAIVIALILAGVSLLIFLRSDIRETTGITKHASINNSDLSESPDKISNLSEDNLSTIESNITSTANDVKSDEFGPSELTDASLGL